MKNRGQLVPEFMVLVVIVLLLFATVLVFSSQNEKRVRFSLHQNEADALALLLTTYGQSATRLPPQSTVDVPATSLSMGYHVVATPNEIQVTGPNGVQSFLASRSFTWVPTAFDTAGGTYRMTVTSGGIILGPA